MKSENKCIDCGKVLSRKKFKRCRTCSNRITTHKQKGIPRSETVKLKISQILKQKYKDKTMVPPMLSKSHNQKSKIKQSLTMKQKYLEKLKSGYIPIDYSWKARKPRANIRCIDCDILINPYTITQRCRKCFQIGELNHRFQKEPWNKNKKLDPMPNKYKEKISEAFKQRGIHQGKNNPMYGKTGKLCPSFLGGKSFEPYTSDFNKRFKESIRERDNHCCVVCNKMEENYDEKLHIHHVDYDKKNSFPQNCVSLCKECHMKTNFNRLHWKTFFQSLLTERYNYEYTQDQKIILDFTGVEY